VVFPEPDGPDTTSKIPKRPDMPVMMPMPAPLAIRE